MNSRNCVISAVGKNSLHRGWTEGNCDFDLHLVVYDDSLEQFRNDAKHVCHIKGYKLKVIYKYLEANPQFKDMYDYYFFPDDDIRMDAATINALFDAMRRYELKIAQPALRMSYYTWPHTLYDKYCRLRYTYCVEMMVPCFSREALHKVLFTFNENETGWGTEAHWPLLIDAMPHDMAVIDEVTVVHTRPIQSGQEIHRRELAAYLKKYGLELWVESYDVIPSRNEERLGCGRSIFLHLRSVLMHWIGSERISSMYIGEDGYFGYVHFLYLLADITQAQKYRDAALDLLGKAQNGLGEIKDDMSFMHGITGCCWLIEYLGGEKLLEEDPKELLEDVDAHIRRYEEAHVGDMALAELAGIGKYYLAKYRNRPDADNQKALERIARQVMTRQDEPQSFHDLRVSLDALEILDGCGATEEAVSGFASMLERRTDLIELSRLEQVYSLFRIYSITGDEYLHVRIREGVKNLPIQLISLAEALMLAEMLYYQPSGNNNH